MGTKETGAKVLRFLLDNRYFEYPEEISLVEEKDVFYVVGESDYSILYASEVRNGFIMGRCNCISGTQKCYKALYGLDAPCEGCTLYSKDKDASSSWLRKDSNGTLTFIRSHYTLKEPEGEYSNIATTVSDTEEAFRHMQRIISSRELVMRCIAAVSNESLSAEKKYDEILKGISTFYGLNNAFILFCGETPEIYKYDTNPSKPLDIISDSLSASDFEFIKSRMVPHSVCYLDDLEAIKDSFPEIYEELISSETYSLLMAPIFKEDELSGLLFLCGLQLNRRDIPILNSIIDMVSALKYETQHRLMLDHIANTDSMTGILNFEGFKQQAQRIIAENKCQRHSLLSVDIRDFRNINDLFGYDAGDDLLKYWAERSKKITKKGDIFCRIQADTFCFLSVHNDEADVCKFFKRITEDLRDYVRENISDSLSLDLVAGAYFIEPDANLTMNEMFNRSHMARSRAKEFPGTKLCIYDKELHDDYRFSKEIEMSFNEAIAKEEIQAFYQPQKCLSDRAKNVNRVRAEALARWLNPDGTVFARPDQFIPIFERTGQISKLDHFIFRQVCKTIRELKRKDISARISINVSRYTMFKPGFVEYYESVRQENNIDYSDIILEFTESISVNDMEKFSSIIKRLRDLGFVCSMDDFGSDYSSLNSLHLLELDELKLDRAFFMGDTDDSRKNIIVNNILKLSDDLKMESVAEGIETEELIEELRKTGCDYVQGFAYAKPMSKKNFLSWIQDNN